MVKCSSCGAENPDNAKYCCQCAEAIKSKKREFIPMCDDGAERNEKRPSVSDNRTFHSMDDFSSKRPVAKSNAFALEDSDDNDSDYSKFRMRDSSEVFNSDESKVFSNNLRDELTERKRRRESAKLVKRADKNAEKKRKNGDDSFESSSSQWKGNDFWN